MTSIHEFTGERGAKWIRMVAPSPGEFEAALADLGLPRSMSRSLYEGEIRSGVTVYGESLLVKMPSLPARGEGIVMFRAVCTPTVLVTEEEEELPAVTMVAGERCSPASPEVGHAILFLELLEAISGMAGPAYLSMRRTLDALTDTIERTPLEVPAESLLAVRRQLAHLSLLWEDQVYCVVELQRHRAYASRSEDAAELLRDLVAKGDRGMKLLGRMEVRLRDLRQHQLQSLEEASNRRLNMLAILSAIYLPATLIAGIYGMNFDNIPITKMPYGYFAVLTLMICVVVGQLWLFRKRGWFK